MAQDDQGPMLWFLKYFRQNIWFKFQENKILELESFLARMFFS
jgi:hypothetical protein